ncbi:MAG: hypothetical protein AAGG45_10840 [Pseudomonadota bacterium]
MDYLFPILIVIAMINLCLGGAIIRRYSWLMAWVFISALSLLHLTVVYLQGIPYHPMGVGFLSIVIGLPAFAIWLLGLIIGVSRRRTKGSGLIKRHQVILAVQAVLTTLVFWPLSLSLL